ncbi:hypothetical protein J2Z23_004385 [Lederbergia galactosidilyticus]|nr:hypothetical protein [Lederbergia galactosidilytica]
MHYVIILLSLFVSTIGSVLILKRKNNKLVSRLSAFALNMFILIGATCILYSMDEEARIFGWGLSENYILILAIPVITWINLLILQFAKKEK